MNQSQTRCCAMSSRVAAILAVMLLMVPIMASAVGSLVVSDAWIREAPPGAHMLAGYAQLHNSGDTALQIVAVESDAFADASLHETVVSGGVSRMRALKDIELVPGASVAFEPGGRHIMLMGPKQPIALGDAIEITFVLSDGSRQSVVFKVRADAP